MLGIITVANDIDGETVLSGGRKYIDAAAFQRRTRELRIAAAVFESAGLAEVAWTGSHAESLIESLKKKLSLKGDRNLFRPAAACFKQNGPSVLIQHFASLSWGWSKWRAHQAGLVSAAPIAALPSHPVTCRNSPGRHYLSFFRSELDSGIDDFPLGHFS